jgi:hypothetical protein
VARILGEEDRPVKNQHQSNFASLLGRGSVVWLREFAAPGPQLLSYERSGVAVCCSSGLRQRPPKTFILIDEPSLVTEML